MRDEALALQLLAMAERWAGAAGTTLEARKHFTATTFSVTRRPEERALLAAAVELYDLVGASPAGARVMEAMKLDPDAGALLEGHDLEALFNEWAATRLTKPADDGSKG